MNRDSVVLHVILKPETCVSANTNRSVFVHQIGLEYDTVTMENRGKFEVALPGNTKVDVGGDVMRMRLIKSPEEIEVCTLWTFDYCYKWNPLHAALSSS